MSLTRGCHSLSSGAAATAVHKATDHKACYEVFDRRYIYKQGSYKEQRQNPLQSCKFSENKKTRPPCGIQQPFLYSFTGRGVSRAFTHTAHEGLSEAVLGAHKAVQHYPDRDRTAVPASREAKLPVSPAPLPVPPPCTTALIQSQGPTAVAAMLNLLL